MQIVPVLDLKAGQVVRGIGGNRGAYRPIETPLSPTAEPGDVLAGLMSLHAFQTVYLADLDAIAGSTPDLSLYRRLAEAHPLCRLWVDCGLKDVEGFAPLKAIQAVRPVAGSETLAETGLLADPTFRGEGILSLDFRGDDFLGDRSILDATEAWPRHLVVMTLAKVGSGLGPDFSRLAEIVARAGPDRQVFAAGGVRGPEDAERLRETGAAGALVASALHDGRLTTFDIERLATLPIRTI